MSIRALINPFFILALLLFCAMNLSKGKSANIRNHMSSLAIAIQPGPQKPKPASGSDQTFLENSILKEQLLALQNWFLSEKINDAEAEKLKSLQLVPQDCLKKRHSHLCKTLSLKLKSLHARVIFKEPAPSGNFVWIDVGTRDNEALKERLVAKNSPVLIGNSVIGIVEKVFFSRSQVRLVTDPMLTPSVRVTRGKEQDSQLVNLLIQLKYFLKLRQDIFLSESEKSESLNNLSQLKDKIEKSATNTLYLAKGELCGSVNPINHHSSTSLLRGVGFNYDSPDEDFNENLEISIIQEGDLLVTTGMDGVFPPGLNVACVTLVKPSSNSTQSYDIEAQMTAGNLCDFNYVSVMPPLSQDEEAL